MEKSNLKLYAEKLYFRMNEEEYDTLLDEFDVMLKQMDLIGKIEGIDRIEPMTFPYVIYHNKLREDVSQDELTQEEVIKNSGSYEYNQIKVPKVVE